MLKSIKFSVQFLKPNGAPGFSCTRSINFEKGLTAITGLNGQGKSLVLEMIQFAFFGIAALRGVSDDYKGMSVQLECWIKGKPYTIDRTISKAILHDGHGGDKTQRASSTKAVNQAIKDLFGYSMSVFQVANAVNQKQVDAFCAMLPTARKKLVDETIGLSALDALVKWIGENEVGVRARIEAKKGLLREPVVPVKPEGYRPAEELTAGLTSMMNVRRDRDLVQQRALQIVKFPDLVELEKDDGLLPKYQEQQATYAALCTEALLLDKDFKALGTVPNVVAAALEDDDEKLPEYQALAGTRARVSAQRAELVRQHGRTPQSLFTPQELDAAEAANELHHRWVEREAMLSEGIAYRCSECGHDGHMHDPRVEKEYGDVPEQEPAGGQLDNKAIAMERAALARQPERLDLERRIFECDEYLSANDDPLPRIAAIEAARKRVQAQQEGIQKQIQHTRLVARRVDLEKRLIANPSTQKDIDRVMQKRHAFALYERDLKVATAKQEDVDEAKVTLAAFRTTLDQEIAALEKSRDDSIIYETNLKHYNLAQEAYDHLQTQIGMDQGTLEDWGNGKLAISDLRTRVKAFLLPSLNKVASYLVSEFTGGVIQGLVINDDFEVLVDGQRVETLSGGGKTAVNLAIRIGLGQVLTNQVFPVLMLDEPDESCDDNRAAFIEKALLMLREKMSQIILVTHKTGHSADHNIHFA